MLVSLAGSLRRCFGSTERLTTLRSRGTARSCGRPVQVRSGGTVSGMGASDGAGRDLERHPSLDDRFDPAVRIVEHDAGWARDAAAELARLKKVLGSVAMRLEHVGSTAVPGLAAKPILDLQLSVAAIGDRAAYVGPLERLGYLFVPAQRSPRRSAGRPNASQGGGRARRLSCNPRSARRRALNRLWASEKSGSMNFAKQNRQCSCSQVSLLAR